MLDVRKRSNIGNATYTGIAIYMHKILSARVMHVAVFPMPMSKMHLLNRAKILQPVTIVSRDMSART